MLSVPVEVEDEVPDTPCCSRRCPRQGGSLQAPLTGVDVPMTPAEWCEAEPEETATGTKALDEVEETENSGSCEEDERKVSPRRRSNGAVDQVLQQTGGCAGRENIQP